MGALTYKIYTLGCKVNQYDSGLLSRKLIQAGNKLIAKNADVAIVNTCAVTKTAIRKGRQMINRARNENPGAKIIITGCWPRIYLDEVKLLKPDMILSESNIGKIINRIKNCPGRASHSGAGELRITNLNKETRELTHVLSGPHITKNFFDKSRYFVKIQDGCEQFCSYCIIPYTRGKLHSRGEKEILSEVKDIVAGGIKEIVLCGIHLGLYGKNTKIQNVNVKINLTSLIKKILKIRNLERIRLSSIEINEISDELIKLIVKEKRFCNHLHIPLQSGSDKILKLMNRPYNTYRFKMKIEKIKKLVPDIAFTTDIMVGFPGETEKDFNDSSNFVKKIGFSRLHVFPFSAHEKTKAAMFAGAVSQIEINKRAEKMRDLGSKLKESFEKKLNGHKVEILIEFFLDGVFKGKSEYYFDVQFNKSQIINFKKLPQSRLIGSIVMVKLNKI